MSSRQPLLHEGRDDLRRTQKVVNDLWRRVPAPGLVYFPAVETIPAFYCVGNDIDTEGAALAKSSGAVFAIGIATQATLVGATVPVRTCGRLNGAVSGRAANDLVYVGTNGALVFAPPAGYVQVIAKCINATDIYVNPEAPTI